MRTLTQPLPVVLVGLGRMGANHLRVLRESPGFRVVAVVDPEHEARRIPPELPSFESVEALEAAELPFDAAVVATATETHYEVAAKLLRAGKHLMVEKPLTSMSEQSVELRRMAEQNGLILAVGHIERFNPAVRKLKEVLESGALGKPIHFSFTRVGGYPDHVKPGNNVLLDLAVHDIDVFRMLVGPAKVIGSHAHETIKPGVLDTAEVMVLSETGVSASIHVNWITPTKIRTIRVTGSRGVCFVDYILQTCELMGGRLLDGSPKRQDSFSSLVSQYRNTDRIVFGIEKREPLRVEIDAFEKALRGDPSSICDPTEAAAAVKLVNEALDVESRPTGFL